MKKKRYQIIDIIFMLALAVSIIVFIVIPFFNILKLGFYREGSWDLAYIVDLFSGKRRLLVNSLRLGFLTTALTLSISICSALYLYLASEKIQKVVLLILGITMISPPFVTALSYIFLFGRRGWISYRLLGLSIQPYGMWGIVCMQALSDFSLCSLLLYGSLRSIPLYMTDSAKSLGADTDHLIVDILLPNMMPGIKAAAILTFLRSISDFGTPAIIGGNYEVLALESYFAVIAEGNLAKAAAMNILLLLPAALLFLLYQKSLKNVSASTHGFSVSESRIERKGLIFFLLSAVAVFFLTWITLQYLSLFLSAFTRMSRGRVVFSLDNLIESRRYIGSAVFRSIGYSLIAALAGSLIGLLLGYYIQIRKSKLARLLDAAATLPYIIPGTFFGLGYLVSFNRPPLMLTGTAAIVVINVLFKQFPFSTKMGNAAMETLNQDVLAAVSDLGGGRLSELRDAVFPLSRQALALSFVNAFTSTMTTVGSIIFLVYPGQKVLTLVMFDVIQSGKYNIGSVLALLIIAICISVNGMYMALNRRLA